MKHIDLYVPSNVLKFSCEMCGKCCKKSWNIDVTKKEYEYLKELYTKSENTELFNEVFEIVNRNSEEKYALIKAKGGCKFLTEDNKCSMHREYGIGALTQTCYNYPKGYTISPRGVEVWLYFSCDAALKTLDSREAIYLVKNPENFPVKFRLENSQEQNLADNLKEFYFLAEDFLLKVMQSKGLTLEERLLVLAYIANGTKDLYLTNEQLPALLSVLENAQKIMNDRNLLNSFNVKANISYQIAYILSTISQDILKRSIVGKELADVLEVLGAANYQEDTEIISQRFYVEYNRRYKENEKEYDHIIENYLCQSIFRKHFTKGFINGFFVMSFFYALVRFFSVYLCVKENKRLDREILFEAIKLAENGFSHNYKFLEAIDRLIKDKEIDINCGISLFKM